MKLNQNSILYYHYGKQFIRGTIMDIRNYGGDGLEYYIKWDDNPVIYTYADYTINAAINFELWKLFDNEKDVLNFILKNDI